MPLLVGAAGAGPQLNWRLVAFLVAVDVHALSVDLDRPAGPDRPVLVGAAVAVSAGGLSGHDELLDQGLGGGRVALGVAGRPAGLGVRTGLPSPSGRPAGSSVQRLTVVGSTHSVVNVGPGKRAAR